MMSQNFPNRHLISAPGLVAQFVHCSKLSQPASKLVLFNLGAMRARASMQHGARLRAEHYRDMAAHFRSLADTEPLASLRRHLRRLAAQHDQFAAELEMARVSEPGAPQTVPT